MMTPAPPASKKDLKKFVPKARTPSVATSSAPLTAQRSKKSFEITPWRGDDGEKTVIYGPSGAGKTTLASLAPGAVFVGLDDGARKIKHPVTGADLDHVDGVETFEDMRDLLHSYDLWTPGRMLVMDTVTKFQELVDAHVMETIQAGDRDSRRKAENLEAYGYGKGYKHVRDTFQNILADLDALVRRRVHVTLLAQQSAQRISNAEGADFIQDGPKLHHYSNASVRLDVMEWADHVFRLGYHDFRVVTADAKATRGKALGSNQRAIYVAPTGPHFVAKSRTIRVDGGAVSYENEQDDSIWRLMFGVEEEA